MLRVYIIRYSLRRCLSVQESANLLGISTNSDKKKIKSAYLEKAKLYHPDVQATGNAQKFKNLSIAQEVLERHQTIKTSSPYKSSFQHQSQNQQKNNYYQNERNKTYYQPNGAGYEDYAKYKSFVREEAARRNKRAQNEFYRKEEFRQHFKNANSRESNPLHDEFQQHDDYKKMQRQNANFQKSARMFINVFLIIIFLQIAIGSIAQMEDRTIIRRAMGAIALKRGLPIDVVRQEYAQYYRSLHAGFNYKLKYISEEDCYIINNLKYECSSNLSFNHYVSNPHI